MHAREPASFWWKNVTVVVILLRDLARMSYGNRLSNVRRLIILRSGKVFTSPPIKITLPTFMAKKSAMKESVFLFVCFFLTISEKSLNQTSYS